LLASSLSRTTRDNDERNYWILPFVEAYRGAIVAKNANFGLVMLVQILGRVQELLLWCSLLLPNKFTLLQKRASVINI